MSHHERNIACLVDELIQRLRRGETIDWPDCLKRYPQQAEELQRLAPTMEDLVKYLTNQPDFRNRGPAQA
jgi:hypothetical protein